jgi:hypothetical protein
MKFEVLAAVKVKMSLMVLCVLAPCRLVGRYQRSRGACCLHLQDYYENGGSTLLRDDGNSL